MSSERHLREAQGIWDEFFEHYPAMVERVAEKLAEAELRGVRAGLAAAGAYADRLAKRERAAGDVIGISADRNAVHDGAWFCAAELRDIIGAIDPASVEVEP